MATFPSFKQRFGVIFSKNVILAYVLYINLLRFFRSQENRETSCPIKGL